MQPVVVVPGWYTEALGNYPVKVMNATYLAGYLAGAKPRFTEEQLRPIIRRFDERCRDLEFRGVRGAARNWARECRRNNGECRTLQKLNH